MATYVKINNNDKLYPATIGGRMKDDEWDNRESKFIHVEMTYEEAVSLFTDNTEWSIVQDVEHQREVVKEVVNQETGEVTQEIVFENVMEQDTYDNSDFSILGDITVHKDGTVSIKMGKLTELEEAYEMMFGGM